MNHRLAAYACSLFITAITAGPALAADDQPIRLFDLSDVELLDGPFLHATRLNRDQLLQYDPDRLLAPFLKEAGLTAKAEFYPNWESSGLAGHTAGHYLSALANTAATLNDEPCRERLDYMVAELARCQEANGDGYVGGIPDGRDLWRQVAAGEISAQGFSLQNRWVPLYNLHKTFAGLRDAYLVAGNEQAKAVLVNLADWSGRLIANLSDAQVQQILRSEHGGMNEVLADVAAITGDDKYLDLAKRFSHRTILDPLAAGQDRLTGLHANTQVPKVVGFERIAQLGGGEHFHRAARFFWDAVVNSRTLAFGGNSISEHFPAPDQSLRWIEHREGPETCNTYNMLRLTELLFCTQPEARLADFYERAMLNHILSSQHPVHGGYVYFTPVRPRHYRVYSEVGQAFWCCVGSGMENHGKYGRFIYAHSDDVLMVNLFVASRLTWREKGATVTQETEFPDQPRTRLTMSLAAPLEFALQVRHPAWVESGALRVRVNGQPWQTESTPSSYVSIDRTWNDGDRVDIELPMQVSVESLPHLDDYVALLFGPVVLAAETGANDLDGLVAGSGRMDHVAHGPLKPIGQAPVLTATREQLPEIVRPVADEPLTFTLADAVQPDEFDELRLIPFFRLHDARYIMYWRLASSAEYAAALAQMKAAEEAQLALDAATVDRVAPGQQQPETEHNFRGERTTTGVWQDRHFRHADGWFSYDLQAGTQRRLTLRTTYFGSDRRQFDLFVNDRLLAEVRLDAPQPGDFIDVDYDIPPALVSAAKDGVLTVKFVAREGSMAGGLFDLRLLADDAPGTD